MDIGLAACAVVDPRLRTPQIVAGYTNAPSIMIGEKCAATVLDDATTRRGFGAPYLLTGHKWFFSVPMSDLFLTLAQTEKGLSCFLATGWLPDGSRNRLKLQRLKDKCGNKSNASSEAEFYGLHAVMLGEEGR